MQQEIWARIITNNENRGVVNLADPEKHWSCIWPENRHFEFRSPYKASGDKWIFEGDVIRLENVEKVFVVIFSVIYGFWVEPISSYDGSCIEISGKGMTLLDAVTLSQAEDIINLGRFDEMYPPQEKARI